MWDLEQLLVRFLLVRSLCYLERLRTSSASSELKDVVAYMLVGQEDTEVRPLPEHVGDATVKAQPTASSPYKAMVGADGLSLSACHGDR